MPGKAAELALGKQLEEAPSSWLHTLAAAAIWEANQKTQDVPLLPFK